MNHSDSCFSVLELYFNIKTRLRSVCSRWLSSMRRQLLFLFYFCRFFHINFGLILGKILNWSGYQVDGDSGFPSGPLNFASVYDGWPRCWIINQLQIAFVCSWNTNLTVLQAFAQLLQAPRDDAEATIKERFPVPRLVICDQHGSQVCLSWLFVHSPVNLYIHFWFY